MSRLIFAILFLVFAGLMIACEITGNKWFVWAGGGVFGLLIAYIIWERRQ